MKVCLVNNLYKPFARGGAERVAELIAKGFKNAGHNVFIISTKPRDVSYKNIADDYKTYRLNSFYYNLGKIPVLTRLFWHIVDMFDIWTCLKIKKILKIEKPDIAITHNLKGISFLAPRVLKKLNIKHIHFLHDLQLLHPSGLAIYGQEKKMNGIAARAYAGLCCLLFDSPSVIISPSKWLLEMHISRGFFKKSKHFVLPNPVLPFISYFGMTRPQKDDDKIKLLYVGQIEEHKGVLFLAKTFLSWRKDNKKTELTIIGFGSKAKSLKQIIKNDSVINFLGHKSPDEVKKAMQLSDCLIVPSLCYENSPAVIYEAASVGLPVIASRIGGITELVHILGGFLFAPGNSDDLIKKLNLIAKNPKKTKKTGESAKKKIMRFTLKNYIHKLLARIY